MNDNREIPEQYSDPERYEILESGAVRDKQLHRFVDNIGGKFTITPATAPLMRRRRIELAQQRAEQALDDTAIEEGKIDESQAGNGWGWYAINKKAAKLAFDANTARGAEGIMSFIGRATGNLTEGKHDEDSTPNEPPQLFVLIVQYLAQLEQEAKPKIIDPEGAE